jgi:putative PIG3 family NAD(P)H quinone oxidoreductase
MGGKSPKIMRAIECAGFGGPEVLRLAERAVPRPKQREVLIRVKAAGVNRPDVLQRKGLYPPPPGASDILGLEVAGIIEKVGPGVRGFARGQKVCALLTGGGYAELAVAPVETLLGVPGKLTFAEAASLPEAFFTVWSTVFDIGRLQEGETVLIHGGASGIGVAAIQLAKAFGAKVIATAGTDEKVKLCKRLGAKWAVNYQKQDFVEEAKAATKGKGVDLVLDMVGGDYIQRNISALALDGRLVFISFLNGASVGVNFAPVLTKRLTLTGATLRARPLPYKERLRNVLLQKVWPLLYKGKIRPVADSAFPLAKAADAHRRMESGAHAGKIVLTV